MAASAAAAATSFVQDLQEWGAEDILVLAAAAGAGSLPDAPIHYTGAAGDTMMTGIRNFTESVTDPSDATRAAVERFDPDGRALVIVESFTESSRVVGRRVFGPRRPEWVALEDKTVIDGVWDRAGVPRAPSAVVPVAEAAAVSADLATPEGTVWTADNREGWHGGAAYTRWVSDVAGAAAAEAWFRDRAHAVRVMPFLDGIPCSIHGLVANDGIATFRPVEMIILRTLDRTLQYAGMATFWDPPQRIRHEMRAVARRTAELLAASVGYLGPFSIDGVCTADGFRPTELNPRMSAGLGMQTGALNFPLGAVTRALVEGLVTVPVAALEDETVAAADAARTGGLSMPVDEKVDPDEMGVSFSGGRARRVPLEDADGHMKIGPSPHGSHLMARFDPRRVLPGPTLAPRAAQAAALASDQWSLGLPALTVAPDVCAG